MFCTKNTFYISVIRKPGPRQCLKESEQKLVDWIVEGAAVGDPKSPTDIKHGAWLLAAEENLDVFGPLGPSNGWLEGFYNRYPELSRRKPEKLSRAAVCVTKNNLLNWFEAVENWLKKNDCYYLLGLPDRIFNADETGFELSPQGRIVLVPKGQKNISVATNTGKEQMTAMYTIGANGWTVNPFVVYSGKRLNAEVKARVPSNVKYTMSPKGWMTEEAFIDYLKFFDEQLTENGVLRPIILTVDSHSSHESLKVRKIT